MQRRQSGVSLFEAMVTLSLAAVFFLMVAPLFVRIMADQQLVAMTNQLVGDLQQARHTAVHQGMPVSLCSSRDGRSCTDTPWSRGYILFTDGGEAGQVDGRDRILRAVAAPDTQLRVTLRGASYIQFLGSGGLAGGTSIPVTVPSSTMLSRIFDAMSPIGTAHAAADDPMSVGEPVAFMVCRGQAGRAIQLSPIGRLNTTAVACN